MTVYYVPVGINAHSEMQKIHTYRRREIYWHVIFIPRLLIDHTCRMSIGAGSLHYITRQSEMANTSPRHMPVLGNIHPIKI